MPIVPGYQRQTQSTGVTGGQFNVQATPQDYGAGIADGVQQYANLVAQEKNKANVALSQNAFLQWRQQAQDQLDNPQNGLLTKQGINAQGASDGYITGITAHAQQLAQTLPEGFARDNFNQQVQSSMISYSHQAKTFEIGQVNQYQVNQNEAQKQMAMDTAQKQFNNPAEWQATMAQTIEQNKVFGISHGWSNEQIEASNKALLQNASDATHKAWFEDKYQASLGPDGKLPITSTSTSDQLWTAMVKQESGIQQFGSDGQPLTSPKGAVGVAQIMPETGPEAARLAGVKWDENRFRTDPSYNALLGKAYLDKQLKDFGNNPVLASAAYNAGPGQVQSWIKEFGDPNKGEISNADFAAKIPFKETREYVSNVTANARAVPQIATVSSLINTPFFQNMAPAAQTQALKQLAGFLDTGNATARVSLQQKMKDDIAKVQNGLTVSDPILPQDAEAVSPPLTSPVDRMKFQQQFGNYQLMMDLQPTYQSIIQGSSQQGLQAVQAIKPGEDDDNFAFRNARYQSAMMKYTQVQKAREQDPGGWLIQGSGAVNQAFKAYAQDPTQGVALAQSIEAQKQLLGIRSNKILPDSMINSFIDKINNNKESSIPDIHSIADQFGQYAPQVLAQMQQKGGSALRVVSATETPKAAVALWQNRNNQTSTMVNAIGKDVAKGIDSNWASQFQTAASTFMHQVDGASTFADINEQGKRLAYIYQSQGVPNPAETAYKDLIGNQYQFNDTWRLPNKLNLDISDVGDGADHYLNSLSTNDIQSFLTDPINGNAINIQQSLDRVKDNGVWVTNNDESGLNLTVNGMVVNDNNGKPITVPFEKLSQLGAENRHWYHSISHWATGGLTTDATRRRPLANDLFGTPTSLDDYRSMIRGDN